MKIIFKRLFAAVLCATLVFCALPTAFAANHPEPEISGESIIDAQTGEASTTFKVLTYSGCSILDITDNFVMGVGGNETLMANVSGIAPIRYIWEITTDGGVTWTAAPGAGNTSTYDITNAQENTPAQQPYIYRLTVRDANGDIDRAEVAVLVSNDYAYRTISLRNGDVDVSAYMHNGTRLVITPLADDTAAIALEAELTPGCLPILLCDVSLVNQNDQVVPYFGVLELNFHVGTEYDGQTLKVFHLYNNNIITYTGVVAGDILSITVNALSPFMVEAPVAANNIHTVTATAGAGGEISPAGGVNVASGTDKTFTFLPNAGYAIDTVTVSGAPVTVTGNSYTIQNITADMTIAVSFREVTPSAAMHTITASSGSHGRISPTGTMQVQHGSAQTFYFYPDNGYELDTLTINGTAVNVLGYSYTLSAVEADATIRATFRAATTQPPNVYKTITASTGANGSISPTGDVSVEYGGGMYFYFIPNTGYEVDKVLIDGVEAAVSGNDYQFINVIAEHTISVTYRPIVPPITYRTITASAGANGAISPEGDVQVPNGNSQTFSFIPNSGYEADTVTVDGSLITNSGTSYTFTNVTADHTISVTFKQTATPPPPITYHTITASGGANGEISPSGIVRLADGGGQGFSFIPNSGYEVDVVTVDGTRLTNPGLAYTFTNVTADHTISVTFKRTTAYHTIAASAGNHGSISPGGETFVAKDGSQTFYFIPDSGYEISGVWIDGVKLQSSTSQYTFENVTVAHTIRVSYRLSSAPPKTGDASSPLLWILLMIAAAALLICCLWYAKGYREKKE